MTGMPRLADSSLVSGETIKTIMNIRKRAVRNRVIAKLEAMVAIEEFIAEGISKNELFRRVSRDFGCEAGFSPGTLRRDYRVWTRGGRKTGSRGTPTGPHFAPRDWRYFLPAWNNGDAAAALTNQAFVTYIRQLFADTSRADATCNAIHERLLDNWYAGDEIPGYGTIDQWCAENGLPTPRGRIRRQAEYPSGWSPSNISRMLPAGAARRAYIQRGEHAAHSHWGDQLLRDRSQLMPFELLTFDDVRFDIRVLMPMPGSAAAQVVYPQAIFALDVATGLIVAKGVMGSYTRDKDGDGGRKGTRRAFQQADMRWLLHSMIERFGIPEWRMNILLENASASLSQADQDVAAKLLGIRFENTGIVRRKLTASGFTEQGGMPWQKGWIEALIRAVHTRINHLEGTVGRRYDLTAGDRDDAVRYTLGLCKQAAENGVPLDELDFPILTLDQFHAILDDYVMRLNWRVRHKLQGFSKVHEFEYSPGEYLRHDHPEAASLIPAGAVLKSRMEAPAERFIRLMQGHKMRAIHPRQLLPLALDKRPVTVAGEKISLKVPGKEDPVIYRSQDASEILAKYNGRKKALLAICAAEYDAVHLFTNDEDLTFLATVPAVGRVDLTDRKAILARAGAVDRGRQIIRDEVAGLLSPREDRLAAMRSRNESRMAAVVADHEAQADTEAENLRTIRRATGEATRGIEYSAESFAAIVGGDDEDRDSQSPDIDPFDLSDADDFRADY